MLAKVSGHSSNNDNEIDDNIECCDGSTTIKPTKANSNLSSSQVNNNNNFNFARVSVKTIKSKIKLNGSYSLTLVQHASSVSNSNSSNSETVDKQITKNNSNLMFSVNQDKIIYNSSSIDNNKSLIKSKSITGCLNGDANNYSDGDDDATKEVINDVPPGDKRFQCNENRINSISYENENHLNICDRSVAVVVDDKGNGIIEDVNDEFSSSQTAAGAANENRSNNTNRFALGNEIDSIVDLKNPDLIVLKSDEKTMTMMSSPREKPTIEATISSSCSSTSNENNNEINVIKSDAGQSVDDNENIQDDTEKKLLNVSHKRNTNPFLNDICEMADGELTVSELAAHKISTIENEIVKTGSDNNRKDDDGDIQPSGKSEKAVEISSDPRLKNLKTPHGSSVSWIEDNQERNLLDYDGDSDELCNSEIFGMRENSAHKSSVNDLTPKHLQKEQIKRNLTSTCENDTSPDNDPSFIIKSAIPTCPFQRQDYKRPGECNTDIIDDGELKREKKLFKLSKKSGNLFSIPSFGKTNGKSTPTLKHVNLHYPDKTCSSSVVDCPSEKKYFEKFHTKAKYQLIKLGQKCKILTHHQTPTTTLPTRMGNVRTTIIKTNTNHRKKYQYYNEINKSYQLDDFIRTTHLLNGNGEDDVSHNEFEADNDGQQNLNNEYNRNSVIYKSYKSEIDLTRNLTYLDAFLNEHFEREPSTIEQPSEQSSKAKNASRHKQHKRMNSCSKNINYSTNVIRHDQQPTMINDTNFDGIDESIDDDCGGRQFYDGNVTSSSFEYTAVKEKMTRKDLQEIISGKSNTTSSSLSSSDYASVYSGGSKEGRVAPGDVKSKLISTPEESIEYYDSSVLEKQNKQKRVRSRRSSQPIPEHTNSYQENDCNQFLLFDEANFVELKNNMKKFHPDLYNSVPQFEDLSAIDFYENPQYHQYDGETLINPYAIEATPTGKRQLSSSYNDRSIHHQDYLEHFQQQQLLGHGDTDVNSNGYTMKNILFNNVRPRTSTISAHSTYNEPSRDVYFNQSVGSANDLYDARKISQKSHSQSITPYGHPHRVIVSKSKKQKGELVLEYEC